MLDMHSHILFNVDDGPKTLNETLQMLNAAVNEGITEIISTSHAYQPQYHVPASTVLSQVELLQNELHMHDIPLKLYVGHEVRINEKLIEQIEQDEVLTLANSKYLLLELPSSTVPIYTKPIINKLISKNIIPIIAHPERNKAIADQPNKLAELVQAGAVAQITAGSLAGHFGKNIQKLSLDLVKGNYVHTYGSDVHNLTTRPFLFDEGLSYLEKNKQLDAVDMLLENNARIVNNEDFILYELEQKKEKKWWNIF